MDFKELLEKYQAVLIENNCFKEELKTLKKKLGISEYQAVPDSSECA